MRRDDLHQAPIHFRKGGAQRLVTPQDLVKRMFPRHSRPTGRAIALPHGTYRPKALAATGGSTTIPPGRRRRARARRAARAGWRANPPDRPTAGPPEPRPASASTVGPSNRSRRGMLRSRSRLMCDMTWMASSEWPPRSKKLSWIPTRAPIPALRAPDGRELFFHRCARGRVLGSGVAAREKSGVGSALRSTLPLVVSGKRI